MDVTYTDPVLSRRSLLSGLSGVALLGLAGCLGDPTTRPADPGPTVQPDAPGPAPVDPTPPSALPRFTDEYLGFTVGKPPGWQIDYAGGVISVAPRAGEDTTVAFVYPVSLAPGATVEDVVEGFVAALAAGFDARDGRLERDGTRLDGALGGATLRGELRSHAVGPQQVVSGGWAPAEEWPAIAGTILGVGAAYDRRPGRPLVRHTYSGTDATGGQTVWEYVVPEGWVLGGAGSRGVDIYGDFDPDLRAYNAHVGFAYLPFGPGGHTPESFAAEMVRGMESYSDFRLLSWGRSRDLGTETDATGTAWRRKSFEFRSTYGIAPLRGVMTVAVAYYEIGYPRPQPYHSGIVWLREIVDTEWDRLAAIAAVVQSYVRVVSSQPGRGVRSPVTSAPDYGDAILDVYERRSASLDYTGREWQEAILSFETCRLPSTGETVEMPASTYYPAGIDGGPAGFYYPHEDGTFEYAPVQR
jgi:hypothetical protein